VVVVVWVGWVVGFGIHCVYYLVVVLKEERGVKQLMW
jgi:hypothetical protein